MNGRGPHGEKRWNHEEHDQWHESSSDPEITETLPELLFLFNRMFGVFFVSGKIRRSMLFEPFNPMSNSICFQTEEVACRYLQCQRTYIRYICMRSTK